MIWRAAIWRAQTGRPTYNSDEEHRSLFLRATPLPSLDARQPGLRPAGKVDFERCAVNAKARHVVVTYLSPYNLNLAITLPDLLYQLDC